MITGFSRHAVLAAAVLALSGLAAAGCQRVPLLAPSGSTITLTTVATALPFNGTTDIVAQVIEPAGTPPHAGTHISFTTSLGRIDPSEAETDINGRATVKFIAGGASGTATIMAASGGATVGASGALKIAVGAAAVGNIALAANPTTVSATGGSSTITASVFDSSGNALTGILVTFTTDAGSVSPSLETTDADGRARTTLTTSRTAKVTATAGIGSVSGTTTTAAPSANVTISVNTTSAITIGSPAPASPAAGQTVVFPLTYPFTSTTGASPVARVIVDWGDGSATQTFTGQPSAISHAYSAAGSYLVRVTGVDTFGDQSTASTTITVTPRLQPSLALSATTAGQTATFTVTATPATGTTIRGVSIDFGDSTSQDLGAATGATTVQHTYASAGTFTARATAVDSLGGTTSASTGVVISALTVGLTSSQNPATLAQQPVTFTATPSSGAQVDHYEWNFGDGTAVRSSSGNTTTHSYMVVGVGTYQVTVTLVTTNGGRASSTIEQRVN